ncbi:P-loop containing nucleoside triphosphate hydrolase protein, partial [Absidia repens]
MTLEIIGAGYGRTGTLSLCNALDILGFKTHHMLKILTDPSQDADIFKHAYEQPDEPVDWERAFSGYTAAVDWPAAAFYEKLATQVYPDAKVILTVRDPEKWYASAAKTIREWPCVDESWPEHILKARRMARVVVKQGELQGDMFQDKVYMIERFNSHIDNVKAIISPENLLVIDVTDTDAETTWKKLAHFLNVPPPPPGTPFPHDNKAQDFPTLLFYALDEYKKNVLLSNTAL